MFCETYKVDDLRRSACALWRPKAPSNAAIHPVPTLAREQDVDRTSVLGLIWMIGTAAVAITVAPFLFSALSAHGASLPNERPEFVRFPHDSEIDEDFVEKLVIPFGTWALEEPHEARLGHPCAILMTDENLAWVRKIVAKGTGRSTEILEHYRLGRRVYSPPHQNLTKEMAVSCRQLRTNTFPHGTLFHLIQQTCYECEKCKVPNNHMVWECQGSTEVPPIQGPTAEQWADQLTSADPDDQVKLVDRARRTARDHGFLD
ncbi:hypothetical protein HPB47_021209 [Ixodes persulcatus]|uniref:Uncharacterized protein n=1 Tax=Ixodes persulcatus TaxID=34615 RepID=A0AC60QD78_IXOPE|nr:hypothetical protein HPB47_021209 [Ixodes persulcatus]